MNEGVGWDWEGGRENCEFSKFAKTSFAHKKFFSRFFRMKQNSGEKI
jgi:hypothetical protein